MEKRFHEWLSQKMGMISPIHFMEVMRNGVLLKDHSVD